MEDRQVRLGDGRKLGYVEYGAPEGKPCFYFHGWPGSRLEARPFDAIAQELDLRIIAVDRPGYGLSDFKPGRLMGEWPADVTELADHLGIGYFAVLGLSGGGPYAAACATKIPRRLTRTGIVSGVGPFDASESIAELGRRMRYILYAAQRAPWLLKMPIWLMARSGRWAPARSISEMLTKLPEADRSALSRPEMRQMLAENIGEAFRWGSRGTEWDGRLYLRPWGFRLKEITAEVYLWHGEKDSTVPVAMGRYQARAIPNCRATFYPDSGHFLIFSHADEILSALAA